MKTFKEKTGVLIFSWQSWYWKPNISHKFDLSDANVMAKRTGSTKWIYHKERGFTSNYFTFLNIWRTSYKELRWCTNYPNVHIHTFHKRWILFESAVSLWVSLKLLRSYQSAKTWNVPVLHFVRKTNYIFRPTYIKFVIYELHSKVINLIQYMFEPKFGSSVCRYLMNYVIYETSNNTLHEHWNCSKILLKHKKHFLSIISSSCLFWFLFLEFLETFHVIQLHGISLPDVASIFYCLRATFSYCF